MKSVGFKRTLIISGAITALSILVGVIYRPVKPIDTHEEVADDVTPAKYSLRISCEYRLVFFLLVFFSNDIFESHSVESYCFLS